MGDILKCVSPLLGSLTFPEQNHLRVRIKKKNPQMKTKQNSQTNPLISDQVG